MDKAALVTGAASLHDFWAAVERDYSNDASHRAFMEACELAGNIGFAAAKYQSILAVQPEEVRAKAQLAEIGRRTMGSVQALRMHASNSASGDWHKNRRASPLTMAAIAVLISCFAVLTVNWSTSDKSPSDFLDGTSRGVGFNPWLLAGLMVAALTTLILAKSVWDSTKKKP